MKEVVFHFNDGNYKKITGYGTTKDECIEDAKLMLTDGEKNEVQSIEVY